MKSLKPPGKEHLFSLCATVLTLISLVLTGIVLGREIGTELGLTGTAGTVTSWAIALIFDALWVGSVGMARRAINQRSRNGMAVAVSASIAAAVVSAVVLHKLGHAGVWSTAPVLAAAFWALAIFSEATLASPETEDQIRATAAKARDDAALARAQARRLASEAETEVITSTAQHLAEAHRMVVQAQILTKTQERIDKARAEAERKLRKVDAKYGKDARAFAARSLDVVYRPAVSGGTGDVPQVSAPESIPPLGAVPPPDDGVPGVTLADVAAVAGVETPVPGEPLSDEQIAVVLRHLRYSDAPPLSYRQASAVFRLSGFKGSQERVRKVWGQLASAPEVEA